MLPDGEQAGKFHVFRIPVLSEPRPRRSDHGPAGPPKVTKTRTVAPRVSEGTGEERRSRGINNLYPRLQRSAGAVRGGLSLRSRLGGSFRLAVRLACGHNCLNAGRYAAARYHQLVAAMASRGFARL